MTTIHRQSDAPRATEVSPAGQRGAGHKVARPDMRARLYRNSLFRHSPHHSHSPHDAAHMHQAAAEHLRHLLGEHHHAHHSSVHHDAHGAHSHSDSQGSTRHRLLGAQPDHQRQQKRERQQQQQQRHAKKSPQTAKAPRRPARHPAHSTWTTRRDAPAARGGDALAPPLQDRGSNSDGGRREPPQDEGRRRAGAIRRVGAVARAELQALAAELADRPLMYASSIREAVIRQRCAAYDPLTVAIDVTKARQSAGDDSRSTYDDLQTFLVDFKRLSSGTRARGALTPLLAFHDLRPSTAILRRRSIVQLEAITLVRRPLPGDESV